MQAHRVCFVLVYGFLPEVVMHSCDNPPCCNPGHLKAGTKALNSADKIAKGRQVYVFGDQNPSRMHPERLSCGDTHYARTNPELLCRGESHPATSFTEEKIREIRQRYVPGMVSYLILAKEYNVGMSTIARIIKRKVWKHV